jgi:hypothetical protein
LNGTKIEKSTTSASILAIGVLLSALILMLLHMVALDFCVRGGVVSPRRAALHFSSFFATDPSE